VLLFWIPAFLTHVRVGWSDVLVFLNYGHAFRQTRKYIHKLIGTKSAVFQFSHNREIETRRFLLHVLDNPGDVEEGARMYVGLLHIEYM